MKYLSPVLLVSSLSITAHSPSLPMAVATSVVALVYVAESYLAHDKAIKSQKSKDIAELEKNVMSLFDHIHRIDEANEQVFKQAEDTKKVLSNANLMAAFTPRSK